MGISASQFVGLSHSNGRSRGKREREAKAPSIFGRTDGRRNERPPSQTLTSSDGRNDAFQSLARSDALGSVRSAETSRWTPWPCQAMDGRRTLGQSVGCSVVRGIWLDLDTHLPNYVIPKKRGCLKVISRKRPRDKLGP